jgi:DNA-binding NarL/FixJ family response regulator
MPDMDGATATATLREIAPAVRVLVLTTYDSDADIVRAVEAGAIGYLLKDVPHEACFRRCAAWRAVSVTWRPW